MPPTGRSTTDNRGRPFLVKFKVALCWPFWLNERIVFKTKATLFQKEISGDTQDLSSISPASLSSAILPFNIPVFFFSG